MINEENKGAGLSDKTTQAHVPNKRPCAYTQNMILHQDGKSRTRGQNHDN